MGAPCPEIVIYVQPLECTYIYIYILCPGTDIRPLVQKEERKVNSTSPFGSCHGPLLRVSFFSSLRIERILPPLFGRNESWNRSRRLRRLMERNDLLVQVVVVTRVFDLLASDRFG